MLKNYSLFILLFASLLSLPAQSQQIVIDKIPLQTFSNGKYNAKFLTDLHLYQPVVVSDNITVNLPKGKIGKFDQSFAFHLDTTLLATYDSVVLVPAFGLQSGPHANYSLFRYQVLPPGLPDSITSAEYFVTNLNAIYIANYKYVKICNNCSKIKADSVFKLQIAVGDWTMKIESKGSECLPTWPKPDCSVQHPYQKVHGSFSPYAFGSNPSAAAIKIREDFCKVAASINPVQFSQQIIYSDCMSMVPSTTANDLWMTLLFQQQFFLYGYRKSSAAIPENTLFNTVAVFPNPADEHITIDLGNLQEATIKVFNTTGQLVHELQNNNACPLKLEVPAGMYIVEISAQEQKRQYKVIKR